MSDMSTKELHAVIYKDAGSDQWAAICLEYSIASQGDSEEDALRMVQEAVEFHLEEIDRFESCGYASATTSANNRRIVPPLAALQLLKMTIVVVLALQGDFAEHAAALHRLGVDTREVRLPDDLDGLDSLIIPGGESTTICRLLETYGLVEPVRSFAQAHPVWGTCAGAIVMARRASDLDRPTLDLIDMEIVRNAFGRQVDSFETDLDIEG